MALTEAVLKAQPSLQGLNDEQLKAIETLSTNDENDVIGRKIGELHGQYDQDVLAVTGLAKNQGEKSYEYVKRVLGKFKGDAAGGSALAAEVQTLKAKVADYEDKFQKGEGSEALAQKLKDTNDKLTALQTKYDADKTSWEQRDAKLSADMESYRVNTEFSKATAKLKFKDGYPDEVKSTLIKAGIDSILAGNKTDWIDNGAGEQILVFRNDKGEIIRNPEKALEPMSAEDLIVKQLDKVLDLGKGGGGGGSRKPGDPTPDKVDITDLASATNQVDADNIIRKWLAQNGYTRGSVEFAQKQTEIRKQYGVEKLKTR